MNAATAFTFIRNDARSCLDASPSVLGRVWVERCDEAQTRIALGIAQSHTLPDLLARVMAGRGVNVEEAARFLEPKLRDLMPDPLLLRDMDKAIQRIAAAIIAREQIAIFGDYDVDGACSAALLAEFLQGCGLNPLIHIPDRLTEGYGPNVEAITKLHAQGARLLITVDCGASSDEPFAKAVDLGIDVVVLDHHQVPETPPPVHALVDPNRQDDLSGLGHLCAAGVVFLCLVALKRYLKSQNFWQNHQEPDLMASLDLVALASIADVVPLKGLNRAFVRQGLQVMRGRGRPGLAALLDSSGLKTPPQAWHLGFLIGPRINAGGRIGDAALGTKLLLTRETSEAARIASELDKLNRERQVIEQECVEQADQMAADLARRDCPVLITSCNNWHMGVVGLVASRLKERYRRPAFAFAIDEEGKATGSGRSIAGVDLGKAVRAAVDQGLAIKGGGHAMAAGVTLREEQIDPFRMFLSSLLHQDVAAARAQDELMVDAVLKGSALSPALVQSLDQAGPYGASHPEPLFAFADQTLISLSEVGSGGHLRLSLRGPDGSDLTAIAFRAANQPLGQALWEKRGQKIHIAGHLTVNTFGGREKVELRVVDVA
jgi:single-stranded-DNA-specific exonuclease